MKNFKTALKILLIGSTLAFTFSCRTPRSSTSNHQVSEKKDVKNDISSYESSSIDEVVSRAVEKLKSGKYGIIVNHVEYDTEKPTDTITGKPPTKSETKTTIIAKEDTKQTEKITVDRSAVASSELYDKSKDNTKVEISEKTETKSGFTNLQITLMCVGFIAILGFVIWLLKKFNLWKRLF